MEIAVFCLVIVVLGLILVLLDIADDSNKLEVENAELKTEVRILRERYGLDEIKEKPENAELKTEVRILRERYGLDEIKEKPDNASQKIGPETTDS